MMTRRIFILVVLLLPAFAAGPATQPVHDTRPIMSLGVAAVEYVTPANPGGWLPSLELTKAGQPTAKATDAMAGGVIAAAKAQGAQGVIIWNGESAARYGTLGFEGTPANHAAWIARLIKDLRAAGLGVGCTIRHTVIALDEHKRPYWAESWAPAGVLIGKIDDATAKGCGDYVYIDSDCDELLTRVMDVRTIAAVHNARPNVLLIPEHGTPNDYSMPFRDTREGPRKGPAGGEVVNVNFGDQYDVKVPPDVLAEIREDVAAGSILMIRAYDSPESRVLLKGMN